MILVVFLGLWRRKRLSYQKFRIHVEMNLSAVWP
uniref:Uncharacterized protein n=1 Tax=Arundo donax TaxID=35708 RepID=A0A0A8XMV9_ARUDO